MYNCEFCFSKYGKKKLVRLYFNLPLFRHYDFSTIRKVRVFFQKCVNCNTVFNYRSFLKEKKIFIKPSYLRSNQTKSKTVSNEKKILLVQNSQAKIIKKFINKRRKLNFLDIGCFDGALLKELNKNFKKSNFFGLESNFNFKKIFPKTKNFRLIENINKFDKKIDCVIFSFSIMYIDNLKEVLNHVKKILNDKGIIYLQIPDIKKNSLYSLMGDQFIIPTEKAIKNIFNIFQFKITKHVSSDFKKDLIFIASKKNIKKIKFRKDKNFENSLKKNKILEEKISDYKGTKLLILGTTINAAFANEILENQNIFVDENQLKVGKYFRNNKVFHPSKVEKNRKVMLNYGVFNNYLQKKLKHKYKLNSIKI